MAYWIQAYNASENGARKKFVCEKLSDINDLPTYSKKGKKQGNEIGVDNKCAYGSEVYVIEDGSKYMLDKSDGEWKKMKVATISGGDNPDIECEEEIVEF